MGVAEVRRCLQWKTVLIGANWSADAPRDALVGQLSATSWLPADHQIIFSTRLRIIDNSTKFSTHLSHQATFCFFYVCQAGYMILANAFFYLIFHSIPTRLARRGPVQC